MWLAELCKVSHTVLSGGIIAQFVVGIYKIAILTFQENKSTVLTYLLLIFLSCDLCFDSPKILAHLLRFSFEVIPQLADCFWLLALLCSCCYFMRNVYDASAK